MIELERMREIARRIHDVLEDEDEDESLGFITLVFERDVKEGEATLVTNRQKREVVEFLIKTLNHIMDMDKETPAIKHRFEDFH